MAYCETPSGTITVSLSCNSQKHFYLYDKGDKSTLAIVCNMFFLFRNTITTSQNQKL